MNSSTPVSKTKKRRAELVAALSAEFAASPSGARLASTAELRKRFDCAGMTIARALDELELRGEIVRIQGKGTFAACRELNTVYVLTPAPSAVWRPEDTLLARTIEAGARLGITVNAIYATSSNHPDDIDFMSLKRIPERAAVIVSGHWYHHMFDFLVERHCNVVYFCNSWDLRVLPEYELIMRWHRLRMPFRSALQEAVRRCKAAGRKRIMFLHGCVHCDTMGIRAFREALRKNRVHHDPGLEVFCFSEFRYMCEILESRLSEVPECDAIIANNPDQAEAAVTVLRKFGRSVPRDMSLVCLRDHLRLAASDMPVTTIDSAPDSAGAAALEMLASGSAEPLERTLDFEVIDRKSI